MIKVLLADDHLIMRSGLVRIIEEAEGVEVVAEASDGREVLKLVENIDVDVVIMDISMPRMDGLEVLDNLMAIYDKTLPVIMLTMHEEKHYVLRSIDAGAMSYITKRSAPEKLVEAVHCVHSGKHYFTENVSEILALHVAEGGKHKLPIESLSKRELQVLKELAMGATNKEIAQSLNLSVKTVDTYRLRLLKKIKLRNNADLSRFAIQNGLI